MNDELLKYYNRELTFIRRMGAEFAEQYPKIAGRLRISEENVEDPHVSRLIEGFSLLTAQIRQKLDDSFPEVTDALLGQLYPDYQAPIPACAILKLTSQNLSTSGVLVARGTEFETKTEGLKNCLFQSCYDTEVLPLEVTKAEFKNAPFNAPTPNLKQPIKALVKLTLTCEFDTTEMHELGVTRLRFYLNGQRHHVYPLYELLYRQVISIGVSASDEASIRYLQPRHIQQVGFGDNESVVPYSQKSFSGYRLLIEQFLCPEKFLFIDLIDLDPNWHGIKDEFNLYFYLSEGATELERHINADSFLLGCTPVINLFQQKLEPIKLVSSQYEYRLAASYLDADVCEIISIQDIRAYDPFGNEMVLNPYYSQGHPAFSQQQNMFWHSRREFVNWAGGYSEAGTEVYLSIIDCQFKGMAIDGAEQDWVIQVNALCSNRNLPSYLPFGGGEPHFSIRSHVDIIKDVRCLIAPTSPVRPALKENTRWQLVNHLTLMSFSGENALSQLQETLKLYDFRGAPESRALIDGITAVTISNGTARVNQQGRVAVCAGSDILIEFSQSSYAGTGVYFFAGILDIFFSQFAAINSYTRLSIKLRDQAQVYHTWPARVGTQVLL